MSYRSDQWFNLESIGGETGVSGDTTNKAGAVVTDADNQKFIYPSRQIRTIDTDGNLQTKTLKRGYIRNLTSENNTIGVPTSKCQFQFNPQYLVQSINQNTSVLNFLQQEPGQYSQPMPGNVNFNFDLFFDRSMELNSGTAVGAEDGLTPPAVNPNDPWSSSPENVGVLHDIGVFFNVIGVGINNRNDEFKNYAKGTIERRITAEINAQNADDDDSGPSAQDQYDNAMSQVNTFLDYNVGNTAFLLPLPVRIVFSSMYIVEGLVQNATITFTKFNSAMIPMQATVNVVFEAKYIGFAKKNTFFTQVLGELDNMELRDDFDIPDDIAEEFIPAIKQDLQNVQMALVSQSQSGSDIYWYRHYMPEQHTASTGVKVGSAMPLLVSNQDLYGGGEKYMEERVIYLKLGFPDTQNGSALLDLINTSDKDISVSISAQAHMWRIQDKALIGTGLGNLYQTARSSLQVGLNANATLAPKKGLTTPAYPADVRDKWERVDSALRAYTTPRWTDLVEDQGGNDKYFKAVYKMMAGYIDDNNVVLEKLKDKNNNDVEVNVFVSGYDQLQDLFRTGLTGKVTFPQSSQQGDTYDRSVDLNGKSAQDYPEYTIGVQDRTSPSFGTENNSTFKFFIKYSVTITVTVDGNEIGPITAVDYVPITEYGIASIVLLGNDADHDNSYSSAKRLQLDWQSLVDEDPTGGGGSTKSNVTVVYNDTSVITNPYATADGYVQPDPLATLLT